MGQVCVTAANWMSAHSSNDRRCCAQQRHGSHCRSCFMLRSLYTPSGRSALPAVLHCNGVECIDAAAMQVIISSHHVHVYTGGGRVHGTGLQKDCANPV